METKRKGYETGWLWTGSVNHVFTVTEQNGIIAQANQWANSNAPNCANSTTPKYVVSITFFKDYVVGTTSTYCFLGCDVHYACCSKKVMPN